MRPHGRHDMAKASIWRQSGVSPAADHSILESALTAIDGADLAGLRSIWRTSNKTEPPKGLSRDLLARVLAHQVQEDALGDLEPRIMRLLDRVAADKDSNARSIKLGSIIIREYQGALHEVTVAPGGYLWRDTLYPSLSMIAKEITGTKWNGPRFFGLRTSSVGSRSDGAGGEQAEGAQQANPVQNKTSDSRRANRRQEGQP
jgi:hypothetical protein